MMNFLVSYKSLVGLLLFVASAILIPQSTSAQTAARPDRGMMPGAAYSVSDIERVNMNNGNVNVSIPLASLPPIAGGKLNLTLSAIYNSKLWNVTRAEGQEILLGGCASWVVDSPQASELGGWSLSGGYRIVFRNAKEDFNYVVPDLPPAQTCEADSAEVLRLQENYIKTILITPDGAEHELRPIDTNDYYGASGGNRPYLYNYYKDVTISAPKRYYSFDGSFIYAVINPTGYTTKWTVYLDDGTKVVEHSDGVQRITDTNGNSIKIFTDAQQVTHYQDEQTTDREIKVSYDEAGNNNKGQTTISYRTVTGVWQNVYINHDTTTVQGKVFRVNDWHPTGGEGGGGMQCMRDEMMSQGLNGAVNLPVIREIVFPATESGQPGREFAFAYTSDTTTSATDQVWWACGQGSESFTRTVSSGMGELNQIITPTGAVVNYDWSRDGEHRFLNADSVARTSITQKELTHDGTAEIWTYELEELGGGGTVTGPDGSVSTEVSYTHDPGSPMFAAPGKAGLSIRSTRSGKGMVERHWSLLPFAGANTGPAGQDSGTVTFNPVVDAEYFTLLENGVAVKMSAKTFQHDYNGNVTQTTEYDWFDPTLVSRDTDGVPTGVPTSATVVRVTNNDYYNPASTSSSTNVYAKRAISTLTPLILSAPQQTSTGTAVAPFSIVQFSYDGNGYNVAPTIGNLTSKSLWDDVDNKWITTSSTYGLYGNLATTTDGRGKVTTFGYLNPALGLPTSVTVDPQNGTGTQTTNTAYDYSTGMVTSTTDPNGRTTSVDYTNQLLGVIDPFGRPGVVIGPDLGGGVNHLAKSFYADASRTVTTVADLNTEGDGLLKSQTISDMLGRTIESRRYENANDFIAVRKSYDTPNRLAKTSNPFRAGEAVVWTTAVSDELGRVISITTPDSAVVTTSYDANFTTVTDQAQKVRRTMFDALGRLIRVDEPDTNGNLGSTSSPNQPTSYDYDVLGNLRHVYQGAQTRTFTYDSLSRLRTAQNPESGTITYTYDDNGNLSTKVDARSITSSYVYDSLNRVTSRSYSDGTPTVSYVYDTLAENGKGRLTSISSSVSTYSYSGYDAMGRVTGASQVIGAQTYTITDIAYDLVGHLKTMKYPSGRTITNTFDGAGRLSSFAGNLGDGTTRTYSTGILYSTFGGRAKEEFGTNTPLFNKSFYNSRGQLAEIRVSDSYSGPTDTTWNRGAIINNYSYQCWGMCGGPNSTTQMTDNNGNLRKQDVYIPDQVGGYVMRWQEYDYDPLNRLQWVREISGETEIWRQSYLYDRYGNRTINSSGTWGAGINNKQFTVDTNTNRLGVPSGQSGAMSYDYAGNMTADTYSGSGVTRVYDAENKMTKETQAGSVDAGIYSYDGEGRRVKRAVGGTETWQVFGIGGELLAEYTSNGTQLSKEYGYRNGELLITATVTTGSGGSPFSFSDDPLVVGTTSVKAAHLNELRTAINQARSHAGLPAASWAEGITAGVTTIKASHVTELRTRLDEARQALALSTGGYTDPALANGFDIKAVHVSELRTKTNEALTTGGGTGLDLRWLVADHLGTPRMIFDQAGSLANVSRHDYLPFGEELYAGTGGRTTGQGYGGDNVRQKFTSKERDNETGLDYFLARYHSSTQGRFTSPDEFSGGPDELFDFADDAADNPTFYADLFEPQSLNKYQYCFNNPLAHVDPDGHAPNDKPLTIHMDEREAEKALSEWQEKVAERHRNRAPIMAHKRPRRPRGGSGGSPGKKTFWVTETDSRGNRRWRPVPGGATWKDLTGRPPVGPRPRPIPQGWNHKHHIFPQRQDLAARFARANININEFLMVLPERVHRELHRFGPRGGAWNQEWETFFNQNPRATKDQIFMQFGNLMRKYRLEGYPIVPE